MFFFIETEDPSGTTLIKKQTVSNDSYGPVSGNLNKVLNISSDFD